MHHSKSDIFKKCEKRTAEITGHEKSKLRSLKLWCKEEHESLVRVICDFKHRGEENQVVLFLPSKIISPEIERYKNKFVFAIHEINLILSELNTGNKVVLIGSYASQLGYDGSLLNAIDEDIDVLIKVPELPDENKQLKKDICAGFAERGFVLVSDKNDTLTHYSFLVFKKDGVTVEIFLSLPPFRLSDGTIKRAAKVKIGNAEISILGYADGIISFCARSHDKINEPHHKAFLKKAFELVNDKELVRALHDQKDITAYDVQSLRKATYGYRHKIVAVGGTFGPLHEGHKELLRVAYEKGKNVLVGVTSDKMAGYKEAILPFKIRKEELKRYLKNINVLGRTKITEINNICGSLIEGANIDAIVVSPETYSNAVKINKMRNARKLSGMKIYILDFLPCREYENKWPINAEEKLSSSNLRKTKVIGIAGLIGTGKSTAASIATKLCYEHSKTCFLIEMDKIGHKVREEPETKKEIVSAFGRGICGNEGIISRKKLGYVVFNNEEMRFILNRIMYPRMKEEALAQISKARKAGTDIVFIEAALLGEIGLDKACDEIWVLEASEEQKAILRLKYIKDTKRIKSIEARQKPSLNSLKKNPKSHIVQNAESKTELKEIIKSLL